MAAFLSIPAAQAGLFQIEFSSPTTGSPNPATLSVVVDVDLDTATPLGTDAIVSSMVNFDVDGGVVFQSGNFGGLDFLVLGGAINDLSTLSSETNDFVLNILNDNGNLSISSFVLTQTGQGFITAFSGIADGSIASVTELPDTPVDVSEPAGLPLLALSAFGVLALRRRLA